MNVQFEYSINGERGFCSGVSYSQAADRAKLKYLARRGVFSTSPEFKHEKSLTHAPKLRFTALQDQRFKELYRCAKDGVLTSLEKAELDQLISITRNL